MNKILRYSLMLLLSVAGFNTFAAEVTDVLTWDKLLEAGKNATYQDFSGKSITSQAVYAGNASSGGDAYIQLRTSKSTEGIVSTISGGKLKSVTIEFNSKTTDRTVDIYGSNTAYTAASDLYDDAKAGTKLASIAANADNKTLTVEGDYTFVGIRSANGAVYVDKITIVWDGEGGTQPSTGGNSVILSWQSDFEQANKLTFEGGYTIQITGNESKNIQNAKSITIGDAEYTTMKVSNGAQNTLTLPEGKAAAKVTFYSYINYNRVDKGSEGRACYWKEVGGTEYTEETAVGGLMTAYTDKEDYQTNPDVRSFTFSTPLNPVTFTNTGEQACYVIEIEVVDAPTTPEPQTSVEFKKATSVESGKSYLIVANAEGVLKAATPITKNYGYLYVVDVTDANGVIKADDETNAFTIDAVEGGYTIKQSDGRYLYQTGTYNSFNVTAEPTEGHIWSIAANQDGTFTITNNAMNKYVQYSIGYKSYGSYAEAQENAAMPTLYVKQSTPTSVTSVKTVTVQDDAIYNLAGQKVGKDYKCLVIMNGRKFIQK